jgi:hypothetical protein
VVYNSELSIVGGAPHQAVVRESFSGCYEQEYGNEQKEDAKEYNPGPAACLPKFPKSGYPISNHEGINGKENKSDK